jgi:hypothetical protein
MEIDVVLVPSGSREWSFPGGDETDDEVILYIVTPGRSWEVHVPMIVGDDAELTSAEPTIVEIEGAKAA